MSDPEPLEREQGRSRIEHEDNLINHRFSWLIMSQSFLLTAFVLLRNNPDYYKPEHLQKTALLVYFIILSGLVVAFCSFCGVLAAFLAIRSWTNKIEKSRRI